MKLVIGAANFTQKYGLENSKISSVNNLKKILAYCRLKNIAGDWIENRIKLSPFKKYCNKDGKLQEE